MGGRSENGDEHTNDLPDPISSSREPNVVQSLFPLVPRGRSPREFSSRLRVSFESDRLSIVELLVLSFVVETRPLSPIDEFRVRSLRSCSTESKRNEHVVAERSVGFYLNVFQFVFVLFHQNLMVRLGRRSNSFFFTFSCRRRFEGFLSGVMSCQLGSTLISIL